VNASPESARLRPAPLAAALAVALLAAAIRLIALDRLPPGLFRDEAEKGYNAFALAETGAALEFDAESIELRRRPFVIRVAGVKTSTIYQYASIPFVKAFGPTVAATRAAAAVAGMLTVALLGLLLLRAWPAAAALAATLWLALCPWHFVFSRWALQGIFVPLGLVGALAGVAAVERGRRWGFALAGASLGFVFYAYAGAQPFVLLFGAALAVVYRREIRAAPIPFAVGVGLLALLAAPRVVVMFGEGGAHRLDAVAVWTAPDATALNSFGRIALNYVAHFNPVFLFFSGDELPRHALPGFGQLIWLDAIFLPLGAWATLRRRLPMSRALLLMFVCGPIGAAITRVGIPHALRALPMVVPAAVWSGVGAVECGRLLAERFSRSAAAARALAAAPALLGLVCAAWALRFYWVEFPERPDVLKAFAANERRALERVFAERGPGDRVFVNQDSEEFIVYLVLFYGRLAADRVAAGGAESLGVYFYIDPSFETQEARFAAMNPGDWIVDAHPETKALTARRKRN
jgi:hypothetical protein